MANVYLKKIDAFKKYLKTKKFNGYVTSDVAEIEYFTGVAVEKSEANVLLLTPKENIVFTKPLAFASLKKLMPFMSVVLAKQAHSVDIAQYILKKKIKNIAFDKLKENYAAGEVYVTAGFILAQELTLEPRVVKDETEIKNLSKACQIAYNAFEHVKPLIKTGMTELQVAAKLEEYMKSNGARATSFRTVVAFGENGADAHHVTGETKLKNEMPILMDFGCIYKGYCSDITRSWWHGKKPSAEYNKVWKIVSHAKDMTIKHTKPGMSAAQSDKICRDIVEAAGYGPFIHSTGHGIGLNIHEAPFLRPGGTEEILKPNNVFTVEPGIYIQGKFGIRLEDSVLMTKTGLKILTKK
ncbi:Xaa-Pro aminopeptidase [Elusimicrobium posterum]|uniref:M24 family metallopeptidase n=1 Tax=Elusimicrobium posterum TaxID=3116653 RepID=UPI003C729FA0